MAGVENFTDPLSGLEIRKDITAQIDAKLATDCNLRSTDAYSGGYSGEITIKLRCHAVRTATVEMTIPISQSPEVHAPGPESFPPEDIFPVEIEETIAIPVEENLKLVRERTQENQSEAAAREPEADEEPNLVQAARPKRNYRRRAVPELAGVGAVAEEPTF